MTALVVVLSTLITVLFIGVVVLAVIEKEHLKAIKRKDKNRVRKQK